MNEPRIRDIPRIRELAEMVDGAVAVKKAIPFLRPLLRLLGADVGKMDDALVKVDDLVRQSEVMLRTPDRFNDLFGERGWIIYEDMKLETATAAVAKAEAGDPDGAEADLVAYHNAENLRFKLRRMQGVRAFRPRMRLAELALADHEAGRYHACVPVVLALLDGLVNELNAEHRGFFSGADLTAWDSMAAHSRGLNALASILRRTRQTTRTETITVPYRNGIMHGMDLGYDNEVVAAKAWAALFAVRDWAMKAERGELSGPAEPPKPKPNLRETLDQISKSAADREALDAWRKRVLVVGVDVPEMGEPEEYTEGTPERKVAEYLKLWRQKNYGHMALCLHPKLGPSPKTAPARVREVYGPKTLVAFEVTKVDDQAAAVTVVETILTYEEGGTEKRTPFEFRLVYVDPEGHPETRGLPGADWAIVFWAV